MSDHEADEADTFEVHVKRGLIERPIVLRHHDQNNGGRRATLVRPSAVCALDCWPADTLDGKRRFPRIEVHFHASSVTLWRVDGDGVDALIEALGWTEVWQDVWPKQ